MNIPDVTQADIQQAKDRAIALIEKYKATVRAGDPLQETATETIQALAHVITLEDQYINVLITNGQILEAQINGPDKTPIIN